MNFISSLDLYRLDQPTIIDNWSNPTISNNNMQSNHTHSKAILPPLPPDVVVDTPSSRYDTTQLYRATCENIILNITKALKIWTWFRCQRLRTRRSLRNCLNLFCEGKNHYNSYTSKINPCPTNQMQDWTRGVITIQSASMDAYP